MAGRLADLLREFFRRGDMLLLSLCTASSVFGLFLVYSATRYDPALHADPIKQAVFLVLGIVCYIVFTMVDVEYVLEENWKFLFFGGLLFLFLLIPFGVEGDTGNRSWMYFPGLPVGIQPAELVKIPFVLILARIMDKNRESGLSRPSSIFLLAGYTILFAGLIAVLSGDYGMVLVYLLLFLVLAWTSGVHRLWFLLAGGLGGGGLALLYFLLWDKLKNVYFIRRVVVIFDHLTGNPDTLTEQTQGIGWQQSRSLLAIGSGQLTGQGFLKGNLTQSPYETSLPARHTDEIFAVCGEEFGLLGCVLLLSLLTAIILRCFWVARRSRSYLSAYIATGFAAMLLIQTVINIAMCLYVFPVVGLTLPFFSYGGSSTLTLYIAMGIISGIRMRFLPSWLRDRSNL